MMPVVIATGQRGHGFSCRDADTSSEYNRNRCRVSLNHNVPNEALLLTRQVHLFLRFGGHTMGFRSTAQCEAQLLPQLARLSADERTRPEG